MTRSTVLMALASIVVAVLLWLQVDSQVDPVTPERVSVPLQMRDLPDNLVVTAAPREVEITYTGTEEQRRRFDKNSVEAFIDLSMARVGRRRYVISINAPTRIAEQITVPRANVMIEVQPLRQVELRVSVETRGSISADLQYDGATVEPEQVTIIGPQTMIDRILKVRAMLDLRNVRPGEAYPTKVEILGEANKPIPLLRANPTEVTVRPGLAAAPATRRLLITPVWEGSIPFGYSITGFTLKPSQIEVQGPPAQLAGLIKIDTRPIPLAGIMTNPTVKVDLQLPPGIKPLGATQVEVTVRVEPRAETSSGS